MKKIFYLKICDTCKRILSVHDFSDFELQDIKSEPITANQLEEMKKLAGSYEALFSRRAKKYKQLGLKDQTLSEEQIKHYILDDYTFLKRPVILDGKMIFIGSEKKNLVALANHLNNK